MSKTIITLIATAIITLALGVVATQHFMVYPEPTVIEEVVEVPTFTAEDRANLFATMNKAAADRRREYYEANPTKFQQALDYRVITTYYYMDVELAYTLARQDFANDAWLANK